MKIIKLVSVLLFFISCGNLQTKEEPFPIILQKSKMECGPTCLQMVCSYYGVEYDIETLGLLSNLSFEGTSMGDIAEASEVLGLETLAVKIDYNLLLEEAPYPAMLHWRNKHFVLVYKMNKDSVWIADPATGLEAYTKEEFLPNWIIKDTINTLQEGYALLFETTETFYAASTKIKVHIHKSIKEEEELLLDELEEE